MAVLENEMTPTEMDELLVSVYIKAAPDGAYVSAAGEALKSVQRI